MNGTLKEAEMLVALLHQASKLEHCLLDAYLYTASSIKSIPEEFELLSNGKHNKRRAIHFEKARQWKQNILSVSHEEMLHLHYVQCLLRALDKPPSFDLPNRDKKTGNWVIPSWDIFQQGVPSDNGTEIPLDGLTIEQVKRFILFESSDSLQDTNPFGPKILSLFSSLYDFELDFHLEGALLAINDDSRRGMLKAKLEDMYRNLPTADTVEIKETLAAEFTEDELSYVRFQSVGDLYTKGILPLYQQAFDKGLVKNSNLTFNNELLGSNAAEGFLPIGPVYRSKNFTDFSNANTQNALKYFKNVKSIINEIVEEGEGFAGFGQMADDFLAKVKEIGGTRQYLQAWKKDKKNARVPGYSTPEWLASAELCRQSHLYRFAMIFMDMELEKKLSTKAGVTFSPQREPFEVENTNHAIIEMVSQMPLQFNSCYLVMLMWLARLYEVKGWQTDKDRRYAIEMIATWPLMSLAIRPFLELISFFPVDKKVLYKLDKDGTPNLPTESLQLLEYFHKSDRSESINKEIDYLALRVLKNAADWSREQIDLVRKHFSGDKAQMVITRLEGLAKLGEFEKQFPFRYHGGYSNQLPDLTYQQEFPDASDYSEDPSTMDSVFKDCLVLKLRFGGFGLVQLSTDPDPPTDESGCSGTHMLHPADGNMKFDRALVWQNLRGQNNILREPREWLPQIGVNVIDFALQITDSSGASAGYVPLQIMQSVGAVQTSGVQQYLQVTGLNDLVSYSAEEIAGQNGPLRMNLLEKNGVRPYLYGDNHLVSKDGEPIDPFIISLTDNTFTNLFQREIYNEGESMPEMSPLQRLETARWPAGFDSNLQDIPEWFVETLPDSYMKQIVQGPLSYLSGRADILCNALERLIANTDPVEQQKTDQIISFIERLYLVSMPRGTTVAWLGILLNYGHSISGDLKSNDDRNLICDFIEKSLNIKVRCLPAASDRTSPNSRWVVKYTQGIMDTDALTNLIYGELFIPLQVLPNNKAFAIAKNWIFTKGMKDVVSLYACDFNKPFWGSFKVVGNSRTFTLPDATVIVETLIESDKTSYYYSATGVAGITDYVGKFSVLDLADESVELKLTLSFKYDSASSFTHMTTIVGGFFQKASGAIKSHFVAEE